MGLRAAPPFPIKMVGNWMCPALGARRPCYSGRVGPIDELSRLLRPAGGGLHLVSTGRDEQLALQRSLYAASDEASVRARFVERFERLSSARVILLGVPSDVGAGFRRGANQAPLAIRSALLARDPDWGARSLERGIVDVGDVFVVPQLLEDQMCSSAQLARTRAALHPDVPASERERLPVSPLSVTERAIDLLFSLAPNAVPLVLGGDHSIAWPVTVALHRARPGFGIVQPDAHTDLLEERLGIEHCFATWSFHASELIGRKGRLVQVGVRASRFPREHWEARYDVRQLWAEEILRDPSAALDAVIAHLAARDVRGVYFSNDIDGTDASFAPATGTPEPGGLSPDWVEALVRRCGAELGIVAADLVEVAPALGTPEETARTLALSARYVEATLDAILGPAAAGSPRAHREAAAGAPRPGRA